MIKKRKIVKNLRLKRHVWRNIGVKHLTKAHRKLKTDQAKYEVNQMHVQMKQMGHQVNQGVNHLNHLIKKHTHKNH